MCMRNWSKRRKCIFVIKNHLNFFPYLYGFVVLATLVVQSCGNNTSQNIAVATAANAQFAINELVDTFTHQTGIECDIIVSSSGKLTAQISEGAPYDIFISADMKYPESLHIKQKTPTPPRVYAYGNLVLWSRNENIDLNIQSLKNQNIQRIAIANPKTAPYGIAAVETLQKQGIYEQVKDKLVYGESISQVNQFVWSGVADVGFTAMSVVLSPRMKNEGIWIAIETKNHTPIQQGAVLINRKNANPEATRFYEFLFSPKAKKILQKYGYETP